MNVLSICWIIYHNAKEVHIGQIISFYGVVLKPVQACLTRQLLRNNRPIIERCTRVYSERYSVLLFRPSVKSWSLTFTFDQSQPRQPGPNQSQSPSGLSWPDPGRGLML